jgi:hypothetical protein
MSAAPSTARSVNVGCASATSLPVTETRGRRPGTAVDIALFTGLLPTLDTRPVPRFACSGTRVPFADAGVQLDDWRARAGARLRPSNGFAALTGGAQDARARWRVPREHPRSLRKR